ncbi:MAG: hypothetical protein J6V01_06755, partial [Clostridia bacterium]|nr:hypothetical protein [Clostridia bacterium]
LNYDGTGLREEQPFLAHPALFRDDFLLAREPLEAPGSGLMCFTPRCVYFNVATREYHDFSDGENMNVVGFRETDGRIYYISSEKAETAFTLNPFTRSAELGMTVEEFYGCEEERMRMYDEIEDAYFNDVMYLKSRNADGSEPVTHFAFPRGLYFDILTDSRYFNSSTGSVSRDGRYFYVVALSLSDGAEVRRKAAIDIETGELLDMQASEANEQFPW